MKNLYYIDTHTHVYPDEIAERTIKILMHGSKTSGKCMPEVYTKGTYDALLQSTGDCRVKTSVVLPVATSPRQFDTINKFAQEINNTGNENANIISLGGIHPDCDDITSKLKFIKDSGLRGIKIHPDYQGAFIDDERYVNIIKECVKLDLIVAIHSGIDVAKPQPVHCTAERARNMLEKAFGKNMPNSSKIIFAHMGANMQYDEVEQYLIDAPVYFDTAYMLDKTDADTTVRIIRRHGTDKILFGTDSPWTSQKEFIDIFEKLPLTNTEKEMIAHKNAERLFDLSTDTL